jgi:hypothetical protein
MPEIPMKHVIAPVTAVLFCAAIALRLEGPAQPVAADDAADQRSSAAQSQDRDRWMAVKLTSAQQILEHLSTGDFDKLQASARRMQVINFLEQWQRDNDFTGKSDYQEQLNAFEFATKELIRHAGDKDIGGALKSYHAVTDSCVQCHILIRDAQ